MKIYHFFSLELYFLIFTLKSSQNHSYYISYRVFLKGKFQGLHYIFKVRKFKWLDIGPIYHFFK